MGTVPQPNAFIPYEVPVPNRRPTSVLVIGILGIVLSSVVLMAAAFTLSMVVAYASFRQVAAANTGGTRADLVWYAVQLIASWMFYSVLLWASIAAIRLQRWAHRAMLRWAGLYLSWLGVEAVVISAWVLPRAVAAAKATLPAANAAFQERMGYVMMAVSVIVSALFPVFVLIFMRKPHVRAAFEGTSGALWPLAGLTAEHSPGATPAPLAVAPDVPSPLPPVAGKAEVVTVRLPPAVRSLAVRFLVLLVLLYRVTLGRLLGGQCRYHPSCSQYAIDAVQKYGPLRGSWRAAKRLCRCHPWGGRGFDPA